MTETKMQLVDWLDDLCVRFIINLPHEELESVERICFQVEEAQWFYEDFIRPLDPDLPTLNLKNFCLRIFQHCPLLSEFSPYHHSTAFSEFLAYKTRVPVRGAIMLNQEMDQVVLVKGWKKSANWSFPRGKINKDEPDLDCAVREVYEETGFHLRDAGLVGNDEDMKYIEVTMREQHMRLYIFRGVPMDVHFEPRTRKEISKIQWYKLSELPTLKKQKQQQEGRGEDLAVNANKFYMVAPFMVQLKKWIAQRKKIEKHNGQSQLSVTSMKMNGNVAKLEKLIEHTDNHNSPPTSDSLEGLMAMLRQSNQAKPASDLSEALKPPMSAQDASAHLKSLLRVAPNIVENGTSSTTASEPLNPSALLALLQPAGSTQDNPSQMPLDKESGPGSTLPHMKGSKSTLQHQDAVTPGNHSPPDVTKIETVDERSNSQPVVPHTPTRTSDISTKPRSGHQDILLNLFRKTPVTETAESVKLPAHSPTSLPTQTLEPPSTLVELSAMPSPVHSRVPSHIKSKPPTLSSGSTVNGPSKVPAEPATTLKPKNPPVSATVNGPLNDPQFEILASNPRAGKGKPPNKHPIPPRQTPVTIISRPVSSRDSKPLVKQEAPIVSEKPPEKPSLTPTDPRFQSLKPVVTDTDPKLNQPQILRRPGPVLRASQDLAVPSPIQPLPSPTLNTRLVSGKKQSKDHKNLLLSLFSKPPSLTIPTTSNLADVISPLSDKKSFQETQSPAVSTAASRPRMGSLTSAIGEESMKPSGGIQTPRTAPKDRTVLLGYLDGVAKGERR